MNQGESLIPSRKRGPQPKLNEASERALLRAYADPNLTTSDVADMFGICRATLHRIVAKHKKNAHQANPVGA